MPVHHVLCALAAANVNVPDKMKKEGLKNIWMQEATCLARKPPSDDQCNLPTHHLTHLELTPCDSLCSFKSFQIVERIVGDKQCLNSHARCYPMSPTHGVIKTVKHGLSRLFLAGEKSLRSVRADATGTGTDSFGGLWQNVAKVFHAGNARCS